LIEKGKDPLGEAWRSSEGSFARTDRKTPLRKKLIKKSIDLPIGKKASGTLPTGGESLRRKGDHRSVFKAVQATIIRGGGKDTV